MEFLANPVVAIVLLIGILVFVHEAGHFLVGKLCGIPVEIFSIGFGPVIFGFKRGETSYRLSLIPLGGFVKFYGSLPSEDVPDFIKGREFFRASVGARFLTILAGPVANLLLAILVFAAMVMHGIKQAPALVGELIPDSPAQRAGLEFGDRVMEINGKAVKSWKDLQRMIGESPGRELVFKVDRQGQQLEKMLLPDSVKDNELPGKRGRIGISPYMIPTVFTRLSREGFVASAGVITGERASVVRWNGNELPVEYWQQWAAFLKSLGSSVGERSFELDLYAYDPSKEESELSRSMRTLRVEVPKEWVFDESHYQQSSGVASSQLTIFKLNQSDIGDLQKGDLIETWNGKKIRNLFEFSEAAGDNRDSLVELGIVRDGVRLQVAAQLKALEVQRLEGKVTIYTLPAEFWGAFAQPDLIEEKYTNPFKAIAYGAAETYDMMGNIGRALLGLFTGEMPLATLGGPIAIAKAASDSVRIGWQAYLTALAVISINLALINLVPIPILDGGQIVLLTAEAIRRRPVPEKAVENYQKIGFVMVLALIIIATYNDVGRFWASMMRGMGSMF